MTLGILQLVYFADGLLFFLASRSDRGWLRTVAEWCGGGALLAHLAYLVHRGWVAGHLPLTNTFETLVLFAFLLAALSLGAHRRYGLPALAGFAGIAAALVLAACGLLSDAIEPLVPSLRSNWLLFHVLACFIGYAAYGVAFAAATAYLLLDLTGRRPETLEFLDWFTYRVTAFGFPLLTLGIVTGAVWANACWGRYWNWDPKETWAFITWIVYAACLHTRYGGMRARTTALLTVIGFGCLLFTYIGVNYWLAGLHDYA